MSDICKVTDGLYISDLTSASDPDLIARYGIISVINVCQDPSPFATLHVPVTDSSTSDLHVHLANLVSVIDEQIKVGSVLVHCHAGISRSVTVCIAFLMLKRNMPYIVAYETVRCARPRICPNPFFRDLLVSLESHPIDRKQIRAHRRNVRLMEKVMKRGCVGVDTHELLATSYAHILNPQHYHPSLSSHVTGLFEHILACINARLSKNWCAGPGVQV